MLIDILASERYNNTDNNIELTKMNFNPLTSKYNKLDMVNIILSLVILLMLSMVFLKKWLKLIKFSSYYLLFFSSDYLIFDNLRN